MLASLWDKMVKAHCRWNYGKRLQPRIWDWDVESQSICVHVTLSFLDVALMWLQTLCLKPYAEVPPPPGDKPAWAPQPPDPGGGMNTLLAGTWSLISSSEEVISRARRVSQRIQGFLEGSQDELSPEELKFLGPEPEV
eukprot:s772_g9.t1